MSKPTTPIKPSPNLSSSSHFTLRTHFKLHPPLPSKPNKPSINILCSQNPQSTNPNPNQNLTLNSILHAIPDWADKIKERGMKKSRSLYSHEKWLEHRSSRRHIRHFLSSLSSRVILSLVPPVIAFTSFAVLIAGYNSAVLVHWLPDFFPVLKASSLPYQLTAPALALLLVFRTEASYSRFEEGRKAWTKVISGTNDFARQVIASVENSNDVSLKKALLQYIMAFPVALKCHLVHGSNAGQDLQSLLEVDDLAVVLSSKHHPRCIIEFISQGLQLLNLEESKRNLLVGVLIEEPFPMLALDELCKLVHDNIQEAIASEKMIRAQLNAKRKRHSSEHSPNGRPSS